MGAPPSRPPASRVHELAVVIPVYRGEQTLGSLVEELRSFLQPTATPGGRSLQVVEIILVHDNGPDDSARVIRELADAEEAVRPVWLARNSGQHGATVAGIASSSATWVVTMDEDGQHHPADIGRLLDRAVDQQVNLVYGRNPEGAPHSWWRNVASSAAKRLASVLAGSNLASFTSFRLIEGSRARAVCAYVGQRTFLDSALTWAIDRSETCETTRREEGRAGSGYSLPRLLSHFWTLVLSSGNRPLRIVSLVGGTAALLGFVAAAAIVVRYLQTGYGVAGWASVITAQLVFGGLILFALGVLAEYVGALLRTAQGRPLYIAVEDPASGPLSED